MGDFSPGWPADRARKADTVVTAPGGADSHWLRAGLAPSSRRAYDRDWTVFTSWCSRTGHDALPAAPATVARFLTEAAATVREDGRHAHTPATLARMISGINFAHQAAGLDQPGSSVIVRAAMRAVRRERATPARRMRAMLLTDLEVAHSGIYIAGWPTV